MYAVDASHAIEGNLERTRGGGGDDGTHGGFETDARVNGLSTFPVDASVHGYTPSSKSPAKYVTDGYSVFVGGVFLLATTPPGVLLE